MKVTLHPAAERDLEEAAEFYEREGSAALAARFVLEFRAVSKLILQHPEIGSLRFGGRRGLSMSVFPFTVIYRVSSDDIKILVVKHDRKRPSYGSSRA
ncbi:type II toxin-antitoxin system RelE/ParE family toxin [Ideonella sp.]|jgi:plasmid stabilization system protein ParE|uniref:type II toxin-antitoxin system RelE/ParE family toxin n=1 Tax=Ideonella sp. TaxID=1929293 RepID=UPI0037BE7ADA